MLTQAKARSSPGSPITPSVKATQISHIWIITSPHGAQPRSVQIGGVPRVGREQG
jgi:hypothetical protein